MTVKGVSEGSDVESLPFNALTLRFADDAVEHEYRAEEIRRSLWIVRLSLFFATILYGSFGILDYHVAGENLLAIWAVRFGIVCPTLGGLFLFTFTKKFIGVAQFGMSAASLVSGLGIVAMTAILDAPANGWYYAGILLVVVYASTLVRLRFLNSVILAFIFLAAYQVSAILINPIALLVLASNEFFLVTTVALSLFASYALDLRARKNFIYTKLLMNEKQRSEELMEKAQAANHAKSEFLASVSHELRTPLNAVIGFSEILMRQLLGPIGSERYRSYAEDIHNSSSHLLSIISDILDLSKAEANQLTVSEEEIDLHETLENALRMVRGDAARKNVTISHQPSADGPIVFADRRLLSQLVINLASNAVKFTPEGGAVVLSVSMEATTGVLITVADNGIGIAKDDIPRVMEPFVQVESSQIRQNGGTGLGLALSKKIAELHGAAFTLESELGRGTIAKVLLPPSRLLGTTGGNTQQRSDDAA